MIEFQNKILLKKNEKALILFNSSYSSQIDDFHGDRPGIQGLSRRVLVYSFDTSKGPSD